MAAVVTGAGVIRREHLIKAGRQRGVLLEGGAAAAADVLAREVPADPVGLAVGVVVVHRVLGALDQVMAVVGGFGRGGARVAELHLEFDADFRVQAEDRPDGEEEDEGRFL